MNGCNIWLTVGPISPLQLMISIPLFFVLTCGIGFILNMILKTTWLPLYLYLGIVAYFSFQFSRFFFADLVVLVAGLFGAVLGGWVIRLLRQKGYRMF